jgi:hypothetical protein
MKITADQIRRLLGEVMYGRGLDYSRKGRVMAVERRADGVVTGKVRGNADKPYTQTIVLGHDAAGGLRRIAGACSCPVGHNCKHVAAALLALAAREVAQAAPQWPALRPAPQPAVEVSLPPNLRAWLTELRAADKPPTADDDAYPAGVKDRLLYVLEVTDEGGLRLEPRKATLLKDGGFSRTVRRYDASGLGWREPPRFVRPADQRILHRLKLLGLDPDR